MTIRTLLLASVAVAGLAGAATAENVLKWGANRDIGSLDPYSYGDSFTINVLNHVYEGLVRYNEDLKIEPALATSCPAGSSLIQSQLSSSAIPSTNSIAGRGPHSLI